MATTESVEVRKVTRIVTFDPTVVKHDPPDHSEDYDGEDCEMSTNTDGFTDTGCSGMCNYLHVDFSACASCSTRNCGTRLSALDTDVEGDTHTVTKIYRSCTTNTNCVDGCDCLDGVLTSCRICDSFQCKRCVSGGVGLMCYDCIDKLIMEDPDLDLDRLDIVGSTKGVEFTPPAVLPVEMDCRRVKCEVKPCVFPTDTHLKVKDAGIQTDIRYLTRDNVPIYCWEHRECALDEECVCTCVGKTCVFNRNDDTCVRCLCDKEPFRPTDSDIALMPEIVKRLMARPDDPVQTSSDKDCLTSVKPDTTTVASGATFSETTGESVESVELGRVSTLIQLGADKPMGGSVWTVRTVYSRPSRIVMNSYYGGNER